MARVRRHVASTRARHAAHKAHASSTPKEPRRTSSTRALSGKPHAKFSSKWKA